MKKRALRFLVMALSMFGAAGCAAPGYADTASLPEGFEPKLSVEQTAMCSIRITAGDTVLNGILYDNSTAWDPAPGYARAFDLPEQIAQKGMPGYEYELGSLAYWDVGPSIALIYKASREQTVVPVVPVGKITSDVSLFEEYGEDITIEIADDGGDVPGSGGGTGDGTEI